MTARPEPPSASPPVPRPTRVLSALLLAAGTALAAAPAPAQEAAPADTAAVARARQLAQADSPGRATDLLAGYLEAHPEEARVRWLYARTLYWAGRPDRARVQYARTLAALPAEPGLRVDYGRFLLETGDPGRAREVLAPAAGKAGRAGRTAAGAEARRLWVRAARAASPRLSLGARYERDSQPLREAGLALEARVPLTTRVEVLLEGRGRRLEAGGGDGSPVVGGQLGLAVDGPGRVQARALAGGLRHGGGERGGWIGEAELAAQLGAGLTLSGSAERWNYRHTRAALDTALFVESAAVRLRRERPTGWGGELGGRIDRFPDGNRVRSAHLWALAPVWSEGGDAVRLGYAFRAADAEESTFRPSRPGQPPGGPGAGGGGVYAPYYTPEQVVSHSAVAALLVRPASGVLLALDGAVGIHATERAPRAASGPTGGTGVEFVRRDYRPWRLRGRLRAETSPTDALELEAAYREDAFFRIVRASLRWTHWIAGAVPGG